MPTFKLFRVPVTIRPSFLVMVALLGLIGRTEPARVAAWVGVVFFSILIHELGHALTARSMGAIVAVELNGLGGLTRWGGLAGGVGPGKRALVAGAGSAVGVAFGGLVWLIASRLGPFDPFPAYVINTLIWVNLFWGLLNWLPIRPLDGGHLLEALLQKTVPDKADAIARVVFTLTAGAALIWALQARLLLIAVLAGWMLLAELGPRAQPQGPPPGIPKFSYDEPEEPEETDPGAAGPASR